MAWRARVRRRRRRTSRPQTERDAHGQRLTHSSAARRRRAPAHVRRPSTRTIYSSRLVTCGDGCSTNHRGPACCATRRPEAPPARPRCDARATMGSRARCSPPGGCGGGGGGGGGAGSGVRRQPAARLRTRRPQRSGPGGLRAESNALTPRRSASPAWAASPWTPGAQQTSMKPPRWAAVFAEAAAAPGGRSLAAAAAAAAAVAASARSARAAAAPRQRRVWEEQLRSSGGPRAAQAVEPAAAAPLTRLDCRHRRCSSARAPAAAAWAPPAAAQGA